MTQSQKYAQAAWSLDDLYPSQESAEMKTALHQLEKQAAEFELVRPQLKEQIDPEDFLDIIQQYEALTELAYRVYSFASLRFSADTQDQAVQTFQAQIEQTMASLENRTLFFSLWWKELDDANAERLARIAGDITYWLEEMRHFKPHTLSEPEEKIINLKNVTGVNAFNMLYDSLTNRYTFKMVIDGEEKALTRGELMVYVRSPDPELRAAAYQELYRVYGSDGDILGQIYQTQVRDWRNEQIDLRHFSSPISARNLRNDIPDQVVETLLSVCQKNAGVFQRFFRLKARLFGVDRLRRYDIYAPVTKTEKAYPFEEATLMVLDSFTKFDPQVAEMARKVFEEKHLDSEVRKGKRGGAFCATVTPQLTPWVLVNYQGRPDDVATLAHELGHAIHSMLAAHHSIFTQNASLPLAETASTFGEMMLVDRLLAEESDPAVRRDMLFRQVDDAYATIQRQAYFALFERRAHEMVVAGASVKELADAYLENLTEQFGDAVEIGDEFRWEWVSIPHIYQVPFYVYAYAFGQLLVLSLYQQYKDEGESFKPRYLKILSAGGSESPEKILAEAGLDIYDENFWQGGFEVLNRLVSELEIMV
jgi:oligoendopeptidase F